MTAHDGQLSIKLEFQFSLYGKVRRRAPSAVTFAVQNRGRGPQILLP